MDNYGYTLGKQMPLVGIFGDSKNSVKTKLYEMGWSYWSPVISGLASIYWRWKTAHTSLGTALNQFFHCFAELLVHVIHPLLVYGFSGDLDNNQG